MHKWGSKDSFPYVITIFSAPNYCGSYNNKAAVLILKQNNLQLKQYQEFEAPYRLPDNLNLISWSMPFLVEKMVAMFYQMLKMCSKAELAELENDAKEGDKASEKIVEMSDELKEKAARRARLKQKIISLGRMNIMLGNLRENSEVILKMKQVSLDGKLPRGLLLKERSSIKFDLEQFEKTRQLDAQNEKRPKKQPRSTKAN